MHITVSVFHSLLNDSLPDENVILLSIWVNNKICCFTDYDNATVDFTPLYNVIYLLLILYIILQRLLFMLHNLECSRLLSCPEIGYFD